MTTFLVAHGAWSAGWAWKKMRPLLRAAGHELFTPTYTGLGERAHLASPAIDLDTHIRDILGVLEMEDLRDVVLIGHSYGGMVATGVADRARERIAQLVYLDAFVPQDGQSAVRPAGARDAETGCGGWRANAGEGWRHPAEPDAARHGRRRRGLGGAAPAAAAAQDLRAAAAPDRARHRRRRAATSIASATGRTTCSASSPSARSAKAAGATSRWTPATTRTSPCRRSCWRCWRRS